MSAEPRGPRKVTIHYFKETGKWALADEHVAWPEDASHYTGWAPFERVVSRHHMFAVCLENPLGYPQFSRPQETASGEDLAALPDDGLHTQDCMEYAAHTRRAFCIAACGDARRERAGRAKLRANSTYGKDPAAFDLLCADLREAQLRQKDEEIARLQALLDTVEDEPADVRRRRIRTDPSHFCGPPELALEETEHFPVGCRWWCGCGRAYLLVLEPPHDVRRWAFDMVVE